MDINEDYKMTKAKSCYHCQPLVKENEEQADRIQHLEQRLAEVEVDFDALNSIEGKLMDMEREWRDKDVGDNPMTIARAQGVADGLYQAAKLFKTSEV